MLPINKENEIRDPNLENTENPPDKGLFAEKYKDYELDPTFRHRTNQQSSNSQPSPAPDPTSSPSTAAPAPNSIDDLRKLISAGYTPSVGLIQDLPNLLKNTDKSEWSNVWFALLIQKLIREQKKK